MTTEEILQRRLFNQHLIPHTFSKAQEIVGWLGAVQSQDFSGANWALSGRLNVVSKKEIEDAFNSGKILRTHVLRPTWHFVTPQDIVWMLALTGERVKMRMSTYNAALGLNDAIFAKSQDLIANALKNHKYLTRNELGTLLSKHGIVWQGNGLAHIVMYAELRGVICSGPKKEKQHTYALLSERVPRAEQLSRDEALQELTTRYFQSHGPAQVIDFVWWSGILTTDAKRGITLCTEIKNETVDGKTYYFFDTEYQKPTRKVYLLANYDEYTVAYADRAVLMENVDKTKLDFRQNSLFNNVVVVHGKVEGVWRRLLKPKSVTIETHLFRELSKSENAEFSLATKEYADFLGLPLKTI